MIIKAVKYFEKGFYAQGMTFGGEDGAEHYDNNVRYRGSLQNYVIDTGDDFILVDTGLPKETLSAVWGGKSGTYLGGHNSFDFLTESGGSGRGKPGASAALPLIHGRNVFAYFCWISSIICSTRSVPSAGGAFLSACVSFSRSAQVSRIA